MLMSLLSRVALVAQQPIVVILSRGRSVGPYVRASVGLSSALRNKSSSADEIPERDVTYHYLFTYLPLNYDTSVVPEYFSE